MRARSDIGKIRRNFSRAAESYNEHAVFQRDSARSLADFAQASGVGAKRVSSVLEVGCGTGFLTARLMTMFPDAEFRINDLSPEMVGLCEAGTAGIRGRAGTRAVFTSGDAMSELDGRAGYDLIAASMVFQWADDIDALMRGVSASLRDGGTLLFSTLCEGTFSSLRTAFDAAGREYPFAGLLPAEKIRDACSGFASVRFREDLFVERHRSALDFLRRLRGTGAVNPSFESVPAPVVRRVIARYPKAEGGGVAAEYRPAYFVCEK